MNVKNASSTLENDVRSDFQPDGDSLELSERARRLKEAVRRAGGNLAVSARSNVALSTLNHYVAGRDMKTSNMVSIARACGVSIAWLAAGEGPMLANAQAEAQPLADPAPFPSEPQKSTSDRVFSAMITIDHEVMGRAIAEAAVRFKAAGKQPNSTQLATVALALYDNMSGQLTKP